MDAPLLVEVQVFAGSQNLASFVSQGCLTVVKHGEHDQLKGEGWHLFSMSYIDTKIDLASVYNRPGDNIILTTENVTFFVHLSPQRNYERTEKQARFVWDEIQTHLDEIYTEGQEEVARQEIGSSHNEHNDIRQTGLQDLKGQEDNPIIIDDDESSSYEVMPNLMEDIVVPPPKNDMPPTEINRSPAGSGNTHDEVNRPNRPSIEIRLPPLEVNRPSMEIPKPPKRRGRPPKKRKRGKKNPTYNPNKRRATDREIALKQNHPGIERQAIYISEEREHQPEPDADDMRNRQATGTAICWIFYPSNDPFRHAQGDAKILPVEQRLKIYRDIIGVGLKKCSFAKKFYQEADYRLVRNSDGDLVGLVDVQDRQHFSVTKLPEDFFPDQKRTNPVMTTDRMYVTREYILGQGMMPYEKPNKLYDVYLYDEKKSQLIKSQFE